MEHKEHEAAILQSVAGEALTLTRVCARGQVDGLLFELTVEQHYRNPSATNIEAVYTFPLPSAAVLLDLDVRLGDRLLTGVVVERRAAEAFYEEAIDKGDTAIMLERAGDGLCTVNLGNLMAGEEAIIRYRYGELLRFEHASVRVTIPTVIAPRYGDPSADNLLPHQVPTADLAVEYPFALSLELAGAIAGGTIASPSHAIAVARTEAGVAISLARAAALDRDFVLTVGNLPAQSLLAVTNDGDDFVALASFCADVPPRVAELPLALKLVVDCSGSMAGDSIGAAKRAVHRILAGLAPADRFSYSRFGSSVHHDIAALTNADAAAILAAAECIARTDADLGGTAMRHALESVFALGGADGAADVLIITDGEVFGIDALVASAQRSRQRVFAVGIGSAPAEGVLRQLAEATGGACEFIAPDEDAEAGILRMFSRLRSPRVERAEITWPTPPKWTTAVPSGLFGGETIHVFAGFDALPAGVVALELVAAGDGGPLTARAALPGHIDRQCDAAADGGGTPRRVGRRRGEARAGAALLAAHRVDELHRRPRPRRRGKGAGPAGAADDRADACRGMGRNGQRAPQTPRFPAARWTLPCLMVESVEDPDMFRMDGERGDGLRESLIRRACHRRRSLPAPQRPSPRSLAAWTAAAEAGSAAGCPTRSPNSPRWASPSKRSSS